jgi:hypothetical protein
MDAVGRIADLPLYYDCSEGLRPSEVRARASRIAAAHGLDLIIVDHMHIMTADNPTGNNVKDLGSIALALANLYKHLDVAGLTLAQLNRGVDARAIKRPMLSVTSENPDKSKRTPTPCYSSTAKATMTKPPPAARPKLLSPRTVTGRPAPSNMYWNAELSMFGNAAQVNL